MCVIIIRLLKYIEMIPHRIFTVYINMANWSKVINVDQSYNLRFLYKKPLWLYYHIMNSELYLAP